MARLRKLENAAHNVEYRIMLESSAYHDYLSRLVRREQNTYHG